MRSIVRCITMGCLLSAGNVPALPSAGAGEDVRDDRRLWHKLIADAKTLKLPTKFIEEIPAGFVHIEFQDLRTFAAEYHPDDHRMVLSRALSLNRAGGVLRPLRDLTNKDLQTLYHELFHAFMDYIAVRSPQGQVSDDFMASAREQQHCRYEHVWITPIPQNKGHIEERFLDEVESWEALNETWAVFVGWAVWTDLEIMRSRSPSLGNRSGKADPWPERVRLADQQAELRGYYEPRDPAEKVMTQKRYLAPVSRISPAEVVIIMRKVLGSSVDRIQLTAQVMEKNRQGTPPSPSCTTLSGPS